MGTPIVRNWEIVMLALHLECGASRRVHTEDITLRCFKLAPDAFSWLRHPEYPDKEVARKDLIRLRDGQYGASFVTGRAGVTKKQKGEETSERTDGWQLSESGVQWIVANCERLEHQLGRREVKATRQEALKHLQRITQHQLYRLFLENRDAFVPPIGELAEMMRCRVDADDRVWASRFTSFKNYAQLTDQADVRAFLERCERLRPSLSQ